MTSSLKRVWIGKIVGFLKLKGSIVDHVNVHEFEPYSTGTILSAKYAPSYKNVAVCGTFKRKAAWRDIATVENIIISFASLNEA